MAKKSTTARVTKASLQAEITKLTAQRDMYKSQIDDIKTIFGLLLSDVFVGEDVAAEIARDAVSERIW